MIIDNIINDIDSNLFHTAEYDGHEYAEYEWVPEAHWLGFQMESYCAGFNYCECNGKHYYTVHHS